MKIKQEHRRCKICSKSFLFRYFPSHKLNWHKEGIYCSRLCLGKDRRLNGNPGWKGEKATFRSIHSWIARNFGRPSLCEHCGSMNAKKFDWSNKNHKYRRDEKDWQRLCRSCHQKYDYGNGLRKSSKGTKHAYKNRPTR